MNHHTDSGLIIKTAIQLKSIFREDFIPWIQDNAHVFQSFERLANMLWIRGRTHYSARTMDRRSYGESE